MSDATPKTHAQPERAHPDQKREPASPTGEHSAESGMETPSLAGLLADPLADPSIDRHVALLSDPRLSNSSSRPLRNQLVSDLQRTYGNLHVQRVMSKVSPSEPHTLAASDSMVVQRSLVGRPRRAGGLIEITVSFPTSWAEFERDIGEGLGSILHTAVAGQLMSNEQFARQLMDYFRLMERMSQGIRSITLGIRVQRAAGTATGTIMMATDPQGEYLTYGWLEGTAGGTAEGTRATEPATATPAAPESATPTVEEAATESQAEQPAVETPGVASTTRTTEAPELRLPIDAIPITGVPVACGPIIIIPSLRLSGTLLARPTRSRLARMTRINLANQQAELAQTFANGMGRMQYEYTREGLAIEVFDKRFNMQMRVEGNAVEFEAPAEDINMVVDEWQIVGQMGLKLRFTLIGNPAVIEAGLAALTAAAAAGALLTQVSRIGTGLAQAVRGLAQQALQGARAIPIIVLPGAVEFLEDLDMRRRQQRGGPGAPPMIT